MAMKIQLLPSKYFHINMLVYGYRSSEIDQNCQILINSTDAAKQGGTLPQQ
jgi:hypothetical protein